MQIPLKINQVYFCDIKRYVLFEIIYAENTGRNLSEIRPSLNIFALTIIFRHNWACPQGFWNICYLIGNVENCLAILPPMKCSRNSRHCKNDSSTVHKWGKLKMKENKRKYFSWWKFFSWKLGQGCGHIWTLSPCDLYKITLGLCANTCILFSKYSILSSSSIPFIGPRW